MIRPLLTSLFVLLSLSLPALAQFPSDVAKGRILTGWRDADGTHYAGLEISLAPGWKTYWRTPGDAGIPPQFNWSGSDNLGAVLVAYPVPEILDQNGLRSIGYKDDVIFPLALTPLDAKRDIHLKGEIQLGVCEDICIPFTMYVDAVLPAASTTPSAHLRSVMADRPMTSAEAGVGKVTCVIEPTSDGLAVTARIDLRPMGREEVAVFELSDRSIWISQADVSRDGAYLQARAEMVPPDAQPFLFSRSDLRITVLGGGQAVDIQGCD